MSDPLGTVLREGAADYLAAPLELRESVRAGFLAAIAGDGLDEAGGGRLFDAAVVAAMERADRMPVALHSLAAVELRDLLAESFPPRCWVLEGLLQERDLAMVHGWRGIGKTRFVHGLACAAASGGAFLRYSAPRSLGVLLVDGETPREELQARLAATVAACDREIVAPVRILAADMLPDTLPSLATEGGQSVIEAQLDGVSLVVLDNISTLCPYGRENEAESWEPLQRWLLSLRRRGHEVLLVHHDGKGGQQRGTSRREDVLSTVLHLRQPADYLPSQGARFEVHVSKGRGLRGEAAQPFEATLATDPNGREVWTWRTLEDSRAARVLALHRDGLRKQRDFAKELGIGLGTVNRLLRQLRDGGEIE